MNIASLSEQRYRQLLLSFLASSIFFGVLVGNAYLLNNIGYPESSFFKYLGLLLMIIGLIALIPPMILFIPMNFLAGIFGSAWELSGRESFIEQNIALWIYCVIFYTIASYLLLRLRSRKFQKIRSKSKNGAASDI